MQLTSYIKGFLDVLYRMFRPIMLEKKGKKVPYIIKFRPYNITLGPASETTNTSSIYPLTHI
jgi:hypothetical protein